MRMFVFRTAQMFDYGVIKKYDHALAVSYWPCFVKLAIASICENLENNDTDVSLISQD